MQAYARVFEIIFFEMHGGAQGGPDPGTGAFSRQMALGLKHLEQSILQIAAMNRHLPLLRTILALLLISMASSRAQNTVFTYQGRLNLNGIPANGSYDLSFGLYATNSGGSPMGNVLTNLGVLVSGGLFTTV